MKAKLSMAFQDLRGKDGTVVIFNTRNGLALRADQSPSNPRTAAQLSARANLSKASRSFKALTGTQVDNWKAYAQTITRTDPITGKSYHPTAIDLYVGFGTKVLQVNSAGTIPATPPATPFSGDSISLEEEQTTGGFTISASAANASGVTTEILYQKLNSAHCTPNPAGYKHGLFKAFTSGSLTTTLNLPAGNYALAYRFVKSATGQVTDIIGLGIDVVTLSVMQGGVDEKSAPASKKKAA